ncbi:MAG: acyl-CoA dehydrogenase family protein [Acidimicrobiales bacterium]
MDTDDRDLLAESVAAALHAEATPAANDAALMALGWHEMLAAEPIDAVAVVFDRLGRVAARSTVLDDVVGAALGLTPGEVIIHPAWGSSEATDRDATRIEGVAGSRIGAARTARVLCRGGIGTVATDRLDVAHPITDRELARVSIQGPLDDVVPLDPAAIEAAVRAARHALAHQLHGLSAGMLTLAHLHALDRVQFGRPIASFQAVRHRLAETHVATEAAAGALGAADEEPTTLMVDLARVLAGRAAIDAGRHCQQVLAGIGFTRDHAFHRFLFATIELDGLYGTTAGLTRQLGRGLLVDRRVRRAVEL